MAVFEKVLLSGSTNGRLIKVAATSTAGTLIHTAVTGTTDIDEIHLYAVNSSGASVKITLEYGGVASPDDLIEETIPAESGLYLTLPGLVLQNALVVRCFAATADVVMIGGYVNRIDA